MARTYTSGIWTVRAGHEDEFVEGWRAFARWALEAFPGAGRPTLLRDLDRPNRFVSFGAWDGPELIGQFLGHPEFAAHVGRLRTLLDGFEAQTLEGVVEPDA